MKGRNSKLRELTSVEVYCYSTSALPGFWLHRLHAPFTAPPKTPGDKGTDCKSVEEALSPPSSSPLLTPKRLHTDSHTCKQPRVKWQRYSQRPVDVVVVSRSRTLPSNVGFISLWFNWLSNVCSYMWLLNLFLFQLLMTMSSAQLASRNPPRLNKPCLFILVII